MKLDLSGYRAAIFDLDGTLVATEHVWQAAKRQVALQHGVAVSDATLAAHVGRGLLDFTGEVLGAVLPDSASRVAAEAAIAAIADANMAAEITVIEGAAQLLAACHAGGLQLAICSSSSRRAIALALDLLGVTPLISVVVSAAELSDGKPHPEPYLQSLRQLGVAADQAIAFEDSLPGAVSAKAAGLFTVVITPDSRAAEFDFCDLRVTKLQELLPVFTNA